MLLQTGGRACPTNRVLAFALLLALLTPGSVAAEGSIPRWASCRAPVGEYCVDPRTVSSDTSLRSALLAAVDTAASDTYRSLKDRVIYIDVERFHALANSVSADTMPLPGNRVAYDQEGAIALCRQKDEGCNLPDAAYVRIGAVKNSEGKLEIFGTIRYVFPYAPSPGEPMPRGMSDGRLRVFTVTLERSGAGWRVVEVLTDESA